MLVIRFQRRGRTNDPAFRVVVAEKRSKPKSGELEILGSYHPKTKQVILKNERILYWMSKGAKASPTVHNLLVSKGVIQGSKINVVKAKPEAASEVPKEEVKPQGAKIETKEVSIQEKTKPEEVKEETKEEVLTQV